MTWGMQRKRRPPSYVYIGGFKRVSRKECWRSPFYGDLPNDHFRKEPTSTPSEINEKGRRLNCAARIRSKHMPGEILSVFGSLLQIRRSECRLFKTAIEDEWKIYDFSIKINRLTSFYEFVLLRMNNLIS
ncbi:hypothetical protein CDAR_198091 [Caerostris darwini]|uniref:Uncharacterized protein n=1 Tax=Caerostris darwini TaxID=1538125 RepID=A0AAV4RHW0_9ARAC|nr:hypothetical protein CDAR_198091 [Caerostris darwini]